MVKLRTMTIYFAQAPANRFRYLGWVVRAEFSQRHRDPLVLYRPTLRECLKDLVRLINLRRQKGTTGDDRCKSYGSSCSLERAE